MIGNIVKNKQIESVFLPTHPPHQIKIPGLKDEGRMWEEQGGFRNESVPGPCLLSQPPESFVASRSASPGLC